MNDNTEIKKHPGGRPRLDDSIARREFIGTKATLPEKNVWKEACKVFGTSVAVGIMIGALQEALKGKK